MEPRQPSQSCSKWWLVFLAVSGLLDIVYGVLVKFASMVWTGYLPARADTPQRRRRGLTLILGGIEGPSLFSAAMLKGVLRSGYRGAIVRDNWNAGLPFWRSIVNLASRKHQERQVGRLVKLIGDYCLESGHGPICIVAQSGGCFIAVRLLESLPKQIRIQTVVMLAASISPGYDISSAAARCDGALYSFGSAGDHFFLGIGTLLCGTSDREFTPSAGFLGWHRTDDRFVDVRWHPRWIPFGYLGNHTTVCSSRFVEHVVGPLLRPELAQNRLISANRSRLHHSLTVSTSQG
ncbi:MAG TPA: hypothetical protein VNT79_11815 [Phycisphaerae bacterium]|nr:hypothetical protein [Phycisphaerae bacterium]